MSAPGVIARNGRIRALDTPRCAVSGHRSEGRLPDRHDPNRAAPTIRESMRSPRSASRWATSARCTTRATTGWTLVDRATGQPFDAVWVAEVPLPSSALLLLSGIGSLLAFRAHRRSVAA